MAVSFIGEKTTDLPQVIDKLYHKLLYKVHLALAGFELTLVVIGNDCIGSYISNYMYHTITTTIATLPYIKLVHQRRLPK